MPHQSHYPTAPYSEPLLPQLDIPSPYYTKTHHTLRAWVRTYIETNISPHAREWETAGEIPQSVYKHHCAQGFGIVHPLTTFEDRAGLALPGRVLPGEWDT